MRRKDRQLIEKDAEKLLESCEYGILSTVSQEGIAYFFGNNICPLPRINKL